MRYLLLLFMMLVSLVACAQVRVLVSDGVTALPYVDVYCEDQQLVYSTDSDGYFSMPDSLGDGVILVFSYMGYEASSRDVGSLRRQPQVVLQSGVSLQEVVVIGRTDERTKDIINRVESVAAADIKLTSPATAADALGQHAGVFIQKSQMGGGSPVIRGFEANKVLLVVDGVRMNNAIYRSGHLQNAITVDAAILDRMEVIYGPGSLVYGSDALGGVVHFRSKMPTLAMGAASVDGEAYVRYGSASGERSAHLHFNAAAGKWASLSSVTASAFDDLRTGRRRSTTYPDFGARSSYVATIGGVDSILQNPDRNVQVGTGYQQLDIVQKVLYQAHDDLRLLANLQLSTSSDVPRYDALTEEQDGRPRYAEWYYGPQQRTLVSLRADASKPTPMYDKLIAIAAYQNIDEDRIDRRYRSPLRDRMNEDVDVYSVTTDLTKAIANEWDLSYGTELTYNEVTSAATTTQIQTGTTTAAALTRYPSGGSSTSSMAAYIYSKKKWKTMDVLAGARYSYNQVNVAYSITDGVPWPQEFYDGLTTSNAALSWSLGGLYRAANDWRIKGQIATAYRTPNVDDLAKIRVNNEEVSVPNLELGPESSITAELTVSKDVGQSQVSATVFSTRLNNVIIRDNYSLPSGQAFLVDEGDTLVTVANVNADAGRIYGLSVNAALQLTSKLRLLATTNYTKGTSINAEGDESPLAHIPPLYGQASLGYTWGRHETRAVWRYNGNKPVELYGGSADNLENATIDGTPSWNTWNIYHSTQWTDWLRVAVSLENLWDVHYRPFSSGVSAAGRHVQVTVGVAF